LAIQLKHFTDEEILAQIDAAAETVEILTVIETGF
jgi:hypothetical protein